MMNRQQGSAVPALMYHSVGRAMPDWKWSFLTVPWTIFEDHLQWLKKEGYSTVNFAELSRHVSGEKQLSARSVFLSFDDGYLDNWTYIAPLLKKYSFCGTVFVNPDFVDPRDIVRPTLEDVWNGHCSEEELEVRGFMSWSELREVERTGILDVQSHGMSHTWYEISDKIVGFHNPLEEHYWLDWNAHPSNKPFYLRRPKQSKVAYGTPIYEHGKSLVARRFYPDKKEGEVVVRYVEEVGGADFFSRPDWASLLMDSILSYRKNNESQAKQELEGHFQERLYAEIVGAKEIIEAQLRKNVTLLCWPGGGYSQNAVRLALHHYQAVTLASSDLRPHYNRVGDREDFLRRIGVPSLEFKQHVFYLNGRYLIQVLREFQGFQLNRRIRQFMKGCELAKIYAGFRRVPFS